MATTHLYLKGTIEEVKERSGYKHQPPHGRVEVHKYTFHGVGIWPEDSGRWRCYTPDPLHFNPPAAFLAEVDEVTIRDYVPMHARKLTLGVYKNGEESEAIVDHAGDDRYQVSLRAKTLATAVALYRAIRAGTAKLTESWEAVAPMPAPTTPESSASAPAEAPVEPAPAFCSTCKSAMSNCIC